MFMLTFTQNNLVHLPLNHNMYLTTVNGYKIFTFKHLTYIYHVYVIH